MIRLKQFFDECKIEVEEILYINKEKVLQINTKSKNIYDIEKIEHEVKELLIRNREISNVVINKTYCGILTKKDKIESNIKNITYLISSLCPAVKNMKDKVDIEATDDKVLIKIYDSILKDNIESKNVEKKIKEYFLSIYFLEVDVNLEDLSKDCNVEEFFKKREEEIEFTIKEQISNKLEAKDNNKTDGEIIKGKKITNISQPISEVFDGDKNITIEGYVYNLETKKINEKRYVSTFVLSDKSYAILCKVFWDDENALIKNGQYIKVKANISQDEYNNREITAMIDSINLAAPNKREDKCDEKRVELHLHTNMSTMDGVESIKNIIKMASEFGHNAIAVTDHAVVQAFPDAMEQGKKNNIKILYGLEGYMVDDTKKVLKEYNDLPLSQKFVVFDIETTGLSPTGDKITEIGAVKLSDGKIVDTFSALINPEKKLSPKIVELTGITDEMLSDKPKIEEVLPQFMKFIDGAMLVAHNSDFDTGFIRQNCENLGIEYNLKAIDTVSLSRVLLPDMKKHKLNLVAKRLGIVLENHHRAVDDAKATAEIFIKFLDMFKQEGVEKLDEVNSKFLNKDYKNEFPFHITILAQNYKGLKNLYKIVSDSHTKHFYRVPLILKSFLDKHREGLLLGSACNSGELFSAIERNKNEKELEDIVKYYDYLEIMPVKNSEHLIKKGIIQNEDEIRNINRKILKLGDRLNKLVVATGDVHYLEKEDGVVRDILIASQNSIREKIIDNGSYYFRTTDEMLEEFSYLGESNAKRVVIENTNKIAHIIENIKPIPDGTFPPKMEDSDTELRELCYKKATNIYGEELPKTVKDRLDRELNSIISNGYAVMYIIAQKLVTKSIADGYLVGSRGSVGSSFAATMSDITEVNPLPPHYICHSCKYSEFDIVENIASGMDLPDKKCPNCNSELIKEGHDIPFETFLGFEGDKEPDIDLNFAGEYQPNAHKYTEELFGSDYVFRAGTIGTIAEKTAYGFVKKYAEEYDVKLDKALEIKLKEKTTGIKRTTGQHPGGVMVVPDYKDIYDFTPVQYPANDVNSGVLTTHFDYHSISGRILKLDILGHDVPTIIRMLEDMTGVKATNIKLDNKETMGIFTSTKPLLCNLEKINCETGTLGIPEFGTKFVRQMLVDTKPTTFAELVQISGLSHGTDVWINNAQEIIRNGIVTLKDVISTRDDIMNYLIQKKLEPLTAFKIMENVRKGKGLTEEHIEQMKKNNVPQWYIDSCQKIKYMFPKAHACAYVMMSFRVAYYKVFHKEAFYATFFTTKADDFDISIVSKGKEHILNNIKELEKKGNFATTKEKSILGVLEVAYEMYQRGVEITKVDIYKSDAKKFKVVDGKLLPPLIAIPGLGETVALNIAEEAKREFISLEDFKKRTKASNTVVDTLIDNGCLENLPQSNQISMF